MWGGGVVLGVPWDAGCCGTHRDGDGRGMLRGAELWCGAAVPHTEHMVWGARGGGRGCGVCAAGGAVCPAVGCRACGAAGCSPPPRLSLCPPALCCSAPHPQRPSLPHVSPPRLTARGLLGLQHRVPPPQPPPSLPPPAPLHGADCHAGINEAGGAGQGPLPWHCLTDAAQALGTGMGGPCEAEPPPQNGEQCPQRPHPSVSGGWMGASQSCGIVKGLCALPGGGAAWMCPPHWGVHSPPHERTLLVAPWGR